MSEQMDDFDVEVSALATTSATPDAGVGRRLRSSLLTTPQRMRLPPGASLWRRAVRTPSDSSALEALITLLAILVAAILLLPTGNRDAFLRLVTPPTPLPTATPQAGDDAFLWEHSVPWGRLLSMASRVPT